MTTTRFPVLREGRCPGSLVTMLLPDAALATTPMAIDATTPRRGLRLLGAAFRAGALERDGAMRASLPLASRRGVRERRRSGSQDDLGRFGRGHPELSSELTVIPLSAERRHEGRASGSRVHEFAFRLCSGCTVREKCPL